MATDNRRTHFYYMQAAKTRGEDAAKALKRAILAQAEVVSNRKLVLHTRAEGGDRVDKDVVSTASNNQLVIRTN